MYVIIAGAGKVGWNLARELIAKDREVTLIESYRRRYRVVEEELEHAVQYGDATELWVLERAGIQRADLVIAVTGDDEDNILICQVAKEKYRASGSSRGSTTRATSPTSSCSDPAGRLGHRPDPAPDRARGPAYGLVQLLALEEEHLEIIELEVAAGAPRSAGRRPGYRPARRLLIISVLRGGTGFVPKADSVIEAGDQVLLILDPGLEEAITAYFAPNGSPRRSEIARMAPAEIAAGSAELGLSTRRHCSE